MKKTERGAEDAAELAQPAELTAARPVSLIVGIGASAGGLAAFKSFFTHMPADSGMAFVLVQHLDPQSPSLLVELLRTQTKMPVAEAKDGVSVAANHIYVIPPDATLTIVSGRLRVVKPAPARQFRHPINTFFCALAEDQEDRAVAIVLSGVGSDGSIGVRTIKEHGGLTIAQAEFDHHALQGMPMSAAATGLVDHILPIEAIPAKLLEHQRHLKGVAARPVSEVTPHASSGSFAGIAELLLAHTGHDFRGYKKNTLSRRVQRRMTVLQAADLPAYIAHLKAEPGELDVLFRELLIGVTEFFRNPEAFEALAAVIGELLANARADDQIRIWVPGCATGEEVYSIAILLREAISWRAATKVVIFGTDIDPNAIATARSARFRKLPPGLSPERFERWFTKDGDTYRPAKEIRDLCVFSEHSVIKDPPFSKLDLVSCRNVLIYLDAGLQHQVMQSFHYALKPDGYLFLGPSESATREAKLFTAVDKKHRLLRRRDAGKTLPSVSFGDALATGAGPGARLPALAEDSVDRHARRALQPFAMAYFVIDAKNEIIRFSGAETAPYLEPSSGPPSFNLFAILRKDLRQPVRVAVHDARAKQHNVVRENLSLKIDGQNRRVTLIIGPIAETKEPGLCVVAFREVVQHAPGSSDTSVPAGSADGQDLEQELRETKSQLQAAVNDLEQYLEETKSATEEHQSINEELQSSNEEIETAKEELQSVNEELQTINAEMLSKNEELMRLNSDLSNLMSSTEIAIVFLDQDLRIKSYTPTIASIFPLREGDIGRPLTQIVSKLIDSDLAGDIAQVQRSLTMLERQVEVKTVGAALTLLMRIRPYRTVDARVEGVVITFVDINGITLANAERARFAALVRASGDAIVGLSLGGVIDTWSPGAEAVFGHKAEEIIGRNASILVPAGYETEQGKVLDRLRLGEDIAPYDTLRQRKDGTLVFVGVRAAPILSLQNTPIGISVTLRDITERKKSDAHKLLLHRELSHRVKNSLAIIQSMARQTLRSTPDPAKFAQAFEGRLQALATAHNILTDANWAGADFATLAREQVAPFMPEGASRLKLKGPPLLLAPEVATTLGLVLHELATNAVKYGSLSVPIGLVSLSWNINDAKPPLMHLIWRESGGPTVAPPKRRGFGSQLIARSGLKTEQTFAPTGLVCDVELALQPASVVAAE